MSSSIEVAYGFMNLQTGRFLRVSRNDEPFDGQEDHADAWFSKDVHDPIWETDDPAVILDILNPWGPLPFLSEDARNSGIPVFGWWFDRNELNSMVPIAFQRTMAPVVPGGDPIPVSMSVSGVHFEDKRDPKSFWLVSLETSVAEKLVV